MVPSVGEEYQRCRVTQLCWQITRVCKFYSVCIKEFKPAWKLSLVIFMTTVGRLRNERLSVPKRSSTKMFTCPLKDSTGSKRKVGGPVLRISVRKSECQDQNNDEQIDNLETWRANNS